MEPEKKEWWKTIALFIASLIVIWIGLQMIGCTPYAEYRHMSDPRVSDDGFDLVCGGAQHATDGLEIHAGLCKDVTGYKGEYVQAGVKYVWE